MEKLICDDCRFAYEISFVRYGKRGVYFCLFSFISLALSLSVQSQLYCTISRSNWWYDVVHCSLGGQTKLWGRKYEIDFSPFCLGEAVLAISEFSIATQTTAKKKNDARRNAFVQLIKSKYNTQRRWTFLSLFSVPFRMLFSFFSVLSIRSSIALTRTTVCFWQEC